jgi:hypothetical protein
VVETIEEMESENVSGTEITEKNEIEIAVAVGIIEGTETERILTAETIEQRERD